MISFKRKTYVWYTACNRQEIYKKITIKTKKKKKNTEYNNQVNYTIGKADCDRNNNRMFVPSVSSGMYIPPSTDTMGHFDKPHCDKTNSGLDRMAPDILDAFKANPFTHSLNSSI